MKKFDVQQLLREAEKMQKQIESKQSELDNVVVEGSAGGGSVIVTANGNGRITGIKISPDVLKEGDTTLLEDMILSAVNTAVEKADRMSAEIMQKTTGGMLPFKTPKR